MLIRKIRPLTSRPVSPAGRTGRTGTACSWRGGFPFRSSLFHCSPSILLLCAVLHFAAGTVFSAELPARARGFQPRVFAFLKARVTTAPGTVLPEATVVCRDGRIVAAGSRVTVPPDAVTIDAAGLHIYAGLIDAGTSRLIDAKHNPPASPAGRKTDTSRYILAATPDDNHTWLSPAWSAVRGISVDDDPAEAARKAGFTAVHVVPAGRLASGTGALLTTAADALDRVLLAEPTVATLKLAAHGGSDYPATLMGATAHVRQALFDAAHRRQWRDLFEAGNRQVPRPRHDDRLDALETLLQQEQPVLFTVASCDDVERALALAAEHHLQPVLWANHNVARPAGRLVQLLAGTRVPVILRLDWEDRPEQPAATAETADETTTAEPEEDEAGSTGEARPPAAVVAARQAEWDRHVQTLATLMAAGVRVAVSSEGLDRPGQLLDRLRVAIDHGLSPKDALAAVTTSPAQLLGVENLPGRIAPGSLAQLTVLTGPLEDSRSQVRYVLIDDELLEFNREAPPIHREPVVAPRPATDAGGEWRIRILRQTGDLLATLKLTQDGTTLRGTFESSQGNGRVTSGQAAGGRLQVTVAVGAGEHLAQLQFRGSVNGHEARGRLVPAFGAPAEWTGVRMPASSASEAANGQPNPVGLSLDLGTGDDDQEGDDAAQPRAASAEATAGPAGSGELTQQRPQPVELEQHRLAGRRMTGGNLFVRGGTVLTGTGTTLENTSIRIEGGRITAIGPDLQPRAGEHVIDAEHRFVLPGIIDTHSHIMIAGGVNEATLSVVPEVRVADAVRTDDVREFRALAAGVTTARLLHGSANVIGGQHAVVKLKYGASIAAHVVADAPGGVKFALGENVKYRRGRFPDTRLGVEATLSRAFLEALDYRRRRMHAARLAKQGGLPLRRDLRLEALVDLVEQKSFIHAHCYRADEILMLMRVASSAGMQVRSLQHVLEGYKIAPEIAAHGASCSTFSDWWAYKVEAFDATPFNAAVLHEAGANVVIKSDDAEAMRHLPMEAAKAIRYGRMAPSAALQMVTRNAARELGLHDRIGTIAVGLDGDLAIFNGHPLSPLSRCEQTIIEGDVWFDRSQLPTAMSPAMQQLTARAPVVDKLHSPQTPAALAPPAGTTWAIVGATVHPADGPVLQKATVVVRDGRILAVGTDVTVPDEVQQYGGTGLHVFPGLIDAGTTLGLMEIGKVRETRDHAETGDLQPDLRAGIAVNRDSELIPVARSGGITLALVQPDGGTVCGQSSLVRLAGWTTPEMIVEASAALRLRWPSGKDRKKKIEEVRELFRQARQYAGIRAAVPPDEGAAPIRDPRLDALLPYLLEGRPVHIEARTKQQIQEALRFAREEKLQMVLTGATDAWKLADQLAQRNIPVILGPVQQAPAEEYDPFDAVYATPGLLHEAGVRFCIRSGSAANSRNAPFEAAVAVAWGLPREAGLRAVTLSAAEILGIAAETGSLTPGKRADLVVADGPPLLPSTEIVGVAIGGQWHAPENRQTRFYETYRQRLEGRGPSSAVTAAPRGTEAGEPAGKPTGEPASKSTDRPAGEAGAGPGTPPPPPVPAPPE